MVRSGNAPYFNSASAVAEDDPAVVGAGVENHVGGDQKVECQNVPSPVLPPVISEQPANIGCMRQEERVPERHRV